MKTEKWYQRRLAKYFEEHYEQYEDDAEWFTDPDINQWLFAIPEFSVQIKLICKDDGTVKEQKYYI